MKRLLLLTAALFCACNPSHVFAQPLPESLPETTAIDQYVRTPDAAFKWNVVTSRQADGIQLVVVDMVSQNWLSTDQVNRPQWRHWVTLAIPDRLTSDVGFLMIGGGSNDSEPPSGPSGEIVKIAKATGTVVAELRMTPNQPLIFHGDGVERKEDDLIGYTWDQYLKTGQPLWLARNAMVKGAVRAMDTMSAVTAELADGQVVDKFVVSGGSKRGWTTWLTGAMDSRVVAIIPIVIDVLNVDASMRHHFAAYGYWAPAIGNYVQHGIMQRLDDPRLQEAYKLIDPYSYRHRLELPKLILNAAGDQFFLPDSSQFYWDELQGEKHIRYVPNTDHSMDESDALESIVAFYWTIVRGVDRPEFTWQMSGGKITVQCQDDPAEVRLWKASNSTTRDFRLETLGKAYQSIVLEKNSEGNYVAEIDEPAKGWTAFFVELTYDVGAPVPLKLTTGVRVLPQDLPYADRDPSLPPSVTLKSQFASNAAATNVAQQAGGLFPQKLAVMDLETEVVGQDCYLNWTPKDFEAEAGAAMKWLESQGCRKLNIQLESGKIITTDAIKQ